MLPNETDILKYVHYALTNGFPIDVQAYFQRFTIHLLVWFLVYIFVCIVVYCRYTTSKGPSKKWKVSTRRTLIVTAHPDDECMFFGPTIFGLLEDGVDVHILCLSDGNHDQLGTARRKELWDACTELGIRSENITLVTETRMPDDPKVKWDGGLVADIIQHHLEAYGFHSLVTFDRNGVSGHLNHVSIFYAVAYLVLENRIPKACSIYTLDSVNVIRKYWGLLDLPLSCMLSSKWYFLTWSHSKLVAKAMRRHFTQLVWFRHLYVAFSRYMLINTLRQVTVHDIELELSLDE